MYDKEAHEKAADAAINGMASRSIIRLGGNPLGPEDPYRFVNPRCSEPVIEVLQPFCPLKWDRLADVTIGIGAGFSNMGEVCGAVCGAIIAIGLDLACRYRDTVALRVHAIKFTQKLMRDFAKEFGSVRCRDLLEGHDISGCLIPGDEAFWAFLREMEKRRPLCFEYVRWAIMYPLPSEQEELHPPL
jgi:C_GCAxxG_C_C family probable redox protein